MPRMSRADSQARTREQLIATAAELFLARGYSATSLEHIAEAAGFSKGAVYSNFSGKDELCLEALRQVRVRRAEGLVALFTTPTTVDAGMAAFADWADRTLGDNDWTSLEIEFAVRARTDEAIRERLAHDAATIRALITAALTALCERLRVRTILPVEEAATALLSLGIGLGIQRALDPLVAAGVLVDTTRALLAPQG